jgi:hypothetical protein
VGGYLDQTVVYIKEVQTAYQLGPFVCLFLISRLGASWLFVVLVPFCPIHHAFMDPYLGLIFPDSMIRFQTTAEYHRWEVSIGGSRGRAILLPDI